jgi:HEPN domain-containing protein
MNELVMEWVEKAEGDSRTAEREGTVGEGPNYDAVCFHAQQCAEKYLKAFLTFRSIPFPRLHDLEALLNLVTPVDPEFEAIREPLLLLNDYAVDIRYPGTLPLQKRPATPCRQCGRSGRLSVINWVWR